MGFFDNFFKKKSSGEVGWKREPPPAGISSGVCS